MSDQHEQKDRQRHLGSLVALLEQEEVTMRRLQEAEQEEEGNGVFAAEDPDETDTPPDGPVVQVETRQGSAVFRVNGTHRQCHLASILPSSEAGSDGSRIPIDFRVNLEAAGYLAMQHFNERNPRVLPHLPDILRDCDVQLSMELRDTRFSPIYAAQHLQDLLQRRLSMSSEDLPNPVALVGAARSAVSQTLSILAGVYELPQISASSTSAALDNKDSSPFFARTVPTNKQDAKATMLYLHSLGVTRLGVMYVQDEFGTVFHTHLLQEASKLDIELVSTSFGDDPRSIETSIQGLRDSRLRYFMGIFNPRTWKTVVREASRAGIIGTPDYVWLLTDASLELTQPGFRLDRETESDLAAAVDGVGVVLLNVERNADFDEALSELETDESFQQGFVDAHIEPAVFDGYDFPYSGSALYQYLNYDAVMALGMAACGAPQEFFTGAELYETLLQTEFVGVSGLVRFSNTTGTRDEHGLNYKIENVRLVQNQTQASFYEFQSVTAVTVNLGAENSSISHVTGFQYAGGSTTTPDPLPPLVVNLNLIPRGVQITGLTLGGLTMLCAACWWAWTIYYRNMDVVRIAQPIFLVQLCVGTFIMASAVIPMSMQEPASERSLDIACMCAPWLLSVGFVTAFSALFSKTWRLNKLFQNGEGFRRVKVKAKDVVLPFVILMFLNVIILMVWTIVAPQQWTRVNLPSFDEFGRYVESYGTCYGGSNKVTQYIFGVLIVVVNVVAMAIALYQSYRARNLPTDFNESFYVSLTTFSLLESFILGVPLLLLVYTSPPADFLVKSVLITIVCLTILLPMFVPKYLQRNMRALRKSQGRPHRRGRVTTGNRISGFPVLATDSGPFASNSSGSLQPRRRSSGGRPALVKGQSAIKRTEDYYVQRATVGSTGTSSSGARRRSVMFRRSVERFSGSSRSSWSRSSLPQDVAENWRNTERASKPSPGSGKQEPRTSVNIAAFDTAPIEPSPEAKLKLSIDVIEETTSRNEKSGVSGVSSAGDKSTAESSAEPSDPETGIPRA